jgi:hypothetical protein
MRVRRILDLNNEHVVDRTLREHFERKTKALSLEMLRTTALIGMCPVLFFGMLDVIDFRGLYPKLRLLRLLEVIICAFVYFSLKTKFVREDTADVGMALMIVSCLDIVATCWLTGRPTSVYYAGINLTILVARAIIEFFFILPVLNSMSRARLLQRS